MTELDPLISCERVMSLLPALRVLDIRSAVDGGARAAYERAHIPGAVHTDYTKDGWRATDGMATGLLPDREALSGLLGRLGLCPEHHVVIASAGTSAGDFSAAARVYWTLKCVGHRAVSILDGGMAKWQSDAARPVEAGEGPPPVAAEYPVEWQSELRADITTVSAAIENADAVLLDSRSERYFAGRDKSPQVTRPGRLPGAVHLDHALAFDPARNGLRPPAELGALFSSVPAGPVVNYCNTGHQAATNWFVLSEVLRRPDVTLYDGSLSQWAEEPTRPVERDAADAAAS